MNALKVVSMRVRGTSTKALEEAGEDSTGLVENKSKLRSKVKTITGVDILTESGDFKSTYEILVQIADVWKDISDTDQAALLEILAGKTRGSVVAALLQQPDVLKNAYQDAMNAEGSALAENEKYLNSIQGRIDLLNNAIQTMWSNAINDDFIKFIVNLAKDIVVIVDKIGLIKALFMAIASYTTVKWAKIDWSGGIIGAVKNIKELTKQTQTYRAVSKELSTAQKNLKTAQERAANTTGKSAKEVYKLQDGVRRAKLRVDTLSKSQKKVETTGVKAFKNIGKSLKSFGKQLNSILTSMATMYLITKAFELIQWIGDKLFETFEETSEKFEDLTSDLSNTKSELQELQSQLDGVNEKIEEINKNGPLSFTDSEELNRLKEQSKELERQIEINKILRDQQQQKVNKSAVDNAEKYKKTNVKSGKTDLENVGSKVGTGALIGGAAASVIGAGAIGSAIAGAIGGSVVPVVGTIIGLVTGALVGAVGGAIVAGVQNVNDQEVGKSLDNMKEQYSKLKDEYAKAQAKYQKDASDKNYEKLQEAQEKLSEYEGQMADTISNLQEYYSQMDWETATDEQKKSMQEFYDTQDKWAIISGSTNAKANAIERIFGDKAFVDSTITEAVKQAKEKYIEALDKGAPITLEEAFEDNPEAFNTLKQRFYDMGLYIADATQYLKDFKEEKDDSLDTTNLYDLSSSMSTAEDAMSSLKSAFDEANEAGQITAKTITSLKETFGSIEGISDEWNNYVNIMMSGVASTEEMTAATEKLAEAWLDERMLNGPLDAMERISTIAALTRMGVTNATEYVDDAMQEAALNEVAKRLQNPDANQSEIISEVAKEYGIENSFLQDNIELLKEKAKLENDLANINKYNANAAEKERLEGALEEEKGRYREEFDYSLGTVYYDTMTGEMASNEAVDNWKSTITQMEDEVAELDQWLKDNEPEIGTNVDAEDIQKNIDEVNNKIETEITKDIQIKIELQNKSQLVDDIQSVFDTLASAQKEYNENGYLTVDTVQSLINLEPKYLALLYDENGKLNLNKDTLYQVAIARLEDMKLKAQDAILIEAETLATNGSIEALNNQIEANNKAAKSYDNIIEQRLDNIRTLLAERKALKDDDPNKLDDSFDVDAYINGLKSQINAVDKVVTSAQNNIRNTLSSSGNTAKDAAQTAFEKLKQKYERQISNYSNQQTYLQNEIDRLQAENEGVSKSYYEEQIAIEEKKLKLYEQERTDLLAMLSNTAKGTDLWYDIASEIWNVEHAIQGSVKAMVDFRKEIVNLYKTAFDDIGTAYEDMDSLFEDQQNYIDKYNELLELQKKPVTESNIKEQLAIEQKQLEANEAQLISLRKTRDDALANSTMQEGDEEWIAMESSIRDAEAAILDNQIAIENYKQAIIDLYTETFDKLNNMFSNKNDFFTSQQDYIEGYADYLETLGVDVPQELYEKLIEIEQDKREVNVNNLVAARNHLADLEKKGLDATDEEWVNAKNKAVELEKAILDNDKAMAEWQKTINELDFTKFDDFIDRIGNLESEIKNIIGLLYKNKEDIALENGDWTDEGITTLGLYYQQMEIAKQKAEEYADEIDKLTKSYKDGEISEKDYYERLQTLKDGQWDAINNYEDMKDAIVDLNEARIDMIEEGYQKEIKAYSELIDLKKKELDAERDLYEFKKNVEDQTKNIAELERKLASLSGSTSAADIAEKRKLEAQLREANQSLNDTYYTHAKDAQGNALDRENELYEKTRTDSIEELREKLKNVDQIIEETISKVLENANITLDTINGVSGEYGISISDNLIKPWQEAAKNAENWKNEVNSDLGEAGSNANKFKVIVQNAFTISGQAAESFAGSVKSVCNSIEDAIGTENEGFTSKLEGYLKYPWENTSAEDGPITTFSDKVETALDDAIDYAEDSYYKMKNNLEAPWKDANLDTFSENVRKVLNQAVKDSEDKAAQISKNLNVTTPNYTSGTAGTSGNGGTTNTGGGKPTNEGSEDVKMLQKILKDIFGQPITVDGKYGSATKSAVKSMQQTLKTAKLYTSSIDGLYGSGTAASLQKYVNSIIRQATGGAKRESWFNGKVVSYFQSRSNYVPSAMYAKGTMGTKRDEWAITDEYGPELTMYATPEGTLSYMRAGSTVIPAEETKKILEMVNAYQPNMMGSGLIKPLINNVVSNNNYNQLSFDSLVHIDNCTEDSIDQVKQIVNDSLNRFAKQMNYRLKHA